MRTFEDASGAAWTATVREEKTPRHHGRWYLVFESEDGAVLPMGEVRWQTRASAERTIRTMSAAELRRRVASLLDRTASP
ncbi:MAG TPA: hypothetical protein VML95_03220 [Longimicrobiales bacterium]|nr:hypothetical protein [Longimicrobiales bacterium]